MGFSTENNYVYCDNLKVKEIQARVPESPFYLYSLERITSNYQAYVSSLRGMRAFVAYAFKANSNPFIIDHLRRMGCGAVLVSENELRLAAASRFDPKRTLFNGNGKTVRELDLAVEQGVMINIDSEFDLAHIDRAARKANKVVDVLIRINPDIDANVHPYVSTGIRTSKFGVGNEQIPWFLNEIKSTPQLNLVGTHCHLGSTIRDVAVFRDAASLMMTLTDTIREQGFDLRYVNIGGGLGIDYEKTAAGPEQADLIDAIRDVLTKDVTLIIEPGRSIVADAGILVSRVLGVKNNRSKNFIVVDASMAELIRPSLYSAYHHIDFAQPVVGDIKTYDVVGPVCESADFLGKDRRLATPHEGAVLVIYDTGAYGYVMSSNYNARLRPAEYIVDGDRVRRIRRAETFDDYVRLAEDGWDIDEGRKK